MSKHCCCYGYPPSCDFCAEGDGVLPSTSYPVFALSADQFDDVTDITPQIAVIPTGCIVDGVHTVCRDSLDGLVYFEPMYGATDVVCTDYLGNALDPCLTGPCWYRSTPSIDASLRCGRPCSNPSNLNPDTVQADAFIDATTDPDYILLIVRVRIDRAGFEACFSSRPYYENRVYYRCARESFTCLCPACFEKYDEQWDNTGESPPDDAEPCQNWPEHLTVKAIGPTATIEQINDAIERCNGGDYGYGSGYGCYDASGGCGGGICVYEATLVGDVLEWVLASGSCITGCRCLTHDELIAAGKPQPTYAGQELTYYGDCVSGDFDCSVDGGTPGCRYVAYDSTNTQGGAVGPWHWGGCDDVECPGGCYLPGPPSTPPSGPDEFFDVVCTSP